MEANSHFQGSLLIIIPHMDDGVLACGGTIAQLSDKGRVHLVYATDGKGSPAPLIPWRDSVSEDLSLVRMQEARTAMGFLGVPKENIHFLDLPDGKLIRNQEILKRILIDWIKKIRADQIIIPFRYDRHPDHLALNRVITSSYCSGDFQAEIIEYFVYYRWHLLPRGDIRKYIHPDYLLTIDISAVSERKRKALDIFKSQTTRYYDWQTRPNLTPELLDEVSQTPEVFLKFDSSLQNTDIFIGYVSWIRIVHWLEPILKNGKDKIIALWHSNFSRNER